MITSYHLGFTGYKPPAWPATTAASFNGVDSRIVLPKMNLTASSCCMEIFVRISNLLSQAAGGKQFISMMRQNTGGAAPDFLLAFQEFGTVLSFGLSVAGSYAELDVSIAAATYQNQWVRLIAHYDGSAKRLYHQFPGGALTLLGTQTASGAVSYGNSSFCWLGGSQGVDMSGTEMFAGLISDMRYWHSAPTTADLAARALTRLPDLGALTGLESYLRLDEEVGATVVMGSASRGGTSNFINGSMVAETPPIGLFI